MAWDCSNMFMCSMLPTRDSSSSARCSVDCFSSWISLEIKKYAIRLIFKTFLGPISSVKLAWNFIVSTKHNYPGKKKPHFERKIQNIGCEKKSVIPERATKTFLCLQSITALIHLKHIALKNKTRSFQDRKSFDVQLFFNIWTLIFLNSDKTEFHDKDYEMIQFDRRVTFYSPDFIVDSVQLFLQHAGKSLSICMAWRGEDVGKDGLRILAIFEITLVTGLTNVTGPVKKPFCYFNSSHRETFLCYNLLERILVICLLAPLASWQNAIRCLPQNLIKWIN